MRFKIGLAVAGTFLAASIGARVGAQGPPAPPATPAAPAGQGAGRAGRGGGRGGPATFPAQQRPPGDPAVVARGKGIYEINCRACHGPDLRGGDQGGPNLLRSQVVLNDQDGELIAPIVHGARADKGMPAFTLPDADVTAVAAYIHDVLRTARGQGAPPAGPPVVLNIVVGNAQAGQAYFQSKCSACHSATGDLAGIASRIDDPVDLQNTWVAGGAGGRGRGRGRGAGAGAGAEKPTTATVTLASGQTVDGRLVRIDDFIVTVELPNGLQRTFERHGDLPKVEVHDPRAPHRDLLPTYTDKDIHDVTAYLVTLK
jgi:cytochrome c oxidase cbb3-type subunit 3